MKNYLIEEIKTLLRNFPEYENVIEDSEKNIIIKKRKIKKDLNRDRITEIVKRLIKEDKKWIKEVP